MQKKHALQTSSVSLDLCFQWKQTLLQFVWGDDCNMAALTPQVLLEVFFDIDYSYFLLVMIKWCGLYDDNLPE